VAKTETTPDPLATLDAAVDTAEAGATAAQRVIDRIEGLSKEARRQLFADPAIRRAYEEALESSAPSPNPDDRPGTVQYRALAGQLVPWQKRPWTWKDLETMPTRTFIPNRNVVIQWNGLKLALAADTEYTVPEVFYGEYERSNLARREAANNARWYFRQPGAVPPDAETARRNPSMVEVRGRASAGHYVPGGGTIETGPPEAEGEAPAEEATP
jgi:hypothetical protein